LADRKENKKTGRPACWLVFSTHRPALNDEKKKKKENERNKKKINK
jgi:hypothetical protein